MQYKKVLVTGADGFIGSHLVEHLVRQGYSVKAFVLYNSFNSWGWLDSLPPDVMKDVEVFTGDIRLIAIPYSYHSPDTYVDTNIKGTLHVLQAARALGVGKVVHTSTSEVYGTAQFVPITEEHPLHAQSPYSATKVAADQLALSFYRSFATPVAVIRPFNTYGPMQSARAVIPTVITQLAAGARSIKLGALSPTRDFNYVLDTVRAFEAVLQADQSVGQVLNAGSNYEISIGDTARLIADIMGVSLSIECDEQRLRPEKSEVERLWADNSRLRLLTDWQPAFGGLDGFRRGLEETICWFSKPENVRNYKAGIYNI